MSNVSRIKNQNTSARWKAVVQYQVTEKETREDVYYFEEMIEFHDLIESGPNWCCINEIKITYNGPKYTLEESMKLLCH